MKRKIDTQHRHSESAPVTRRKSKPSTLASAVPMETIMLTNATDADNSATLAPLVHAQPELLMDTNGENVHLADPSTGNEHVSGEHISVGDHVAAVPVNSEFTAHMPGNAYLAGMGIFTVMVVATGVASMAAVSLMTGPFLLARRMAALVTLFG